MIRMETSTELKVTALMTAPRHEIVLCRNYIEAALRYAGVPLVVSGGVFYGQCMQRMLEEAIENGADVAITVDFDSLFSGKDVQRLLSKLVSYDVDAIAAIQCRRGKRFPLLTIANSKLHHVDDRPFKVDTAHFGLTAINLHKLKKTPKPWFWSKPDEDGKWSKDKIDDDIWFWQQWREAGHSIWVDPETRIGHLEEMVTMFDERMNPVHMYPWEWAEQAYPKIKREGTLVVVGANIGGEKIENLCYLHERAYLFEPYGPAAEKLRQTAGKIPGVEVIEAACDVETGRRQMNVYNQFGLSSSFGEITQQAMNAYGNFDLSLRGQVEVQTFNLAEWLSERHIENVRTLCVDAQGMDLAILKTLFSWFRDARIGQVQCEVDADDFQHYVGTPNNQQSDVLEYMASFPYLCEVKRGDDYQLDLLFSCQEAACLA
jgi:FkbM family methyltransferase